MIGKLTTDRQAKLGADGYGALVTPNRRNRIVSVGSKVSGKFWPGALGQCKHFQGTTHSHRKERTVGEIQPNGAGPDEAHLTTESTERVKKGSRVVCQWAHRFYGLGTMMTGGEKKHQRGWEGVPTPQGEQLGSLEYVLNKDTRDYCPQAKKQKRRMLVGVRG